MMLCCLASLAFIVGFIDFARRMKTLLWFIIQNTFLKREPDLMGKYGVPG